MSEVNFYSTAGHCSDGLGMRPTITWQANTPQSLKLDWRGMPCVVQEFKVHEWIGINTLKIFHACVCVCVCVSVHLLGDRWVVLDH